ncbi:MAG TPA: TonB-dependent receptor, partial [Thermoanaerobaculia bacterium]|nr:TonB-dependent receptor [Thermoanaerobaculia bacterium]
GAIVLLGNNTTVNLSINPQVSESITVTAAAPVVDTTRTGTAQSVTEEQIENLPILGRDFKALAQLTPGVASAFGGRITSNGARGIATDFNIDGASSNNDFFGEQTGGTRAPFTFSQAAIKEFQVIRSQYNAEYGRGVGAQLNAITKSGSNEFDGEAFYFLRKTAWASTRPTRLPNGVAVTDSFRGRNSTQPGFAVGGPIQHDRLFFFVNFDGQRQKLPVSATDIRRNATFSALPEATRTAFFAKVQGLIGFPYEQGIEYDQSFDQDTYLIKLDANVGSKNHFSLRDNYTSFENGNNQSFNHLSNQGVETDKFNQLVLQGETVFTGNLFNQFLAQYTSDERPVDPNTTTPEVVVTYAPNTTVFLGQNDFLPNNTKEKKIQLKDSIQYIWNDHTFKVGAEGLLMSIDNLFPRNLSGVYRYNSVQDFIDNKPASFNQGFGPGGGLTSWDQNTYALFVSDSFRVGTHLTFDAGVRYDWQTIPEPETNAFPQHPEFITQIEEDKDNYAPRFGFAWDLLGTGRSVLRGGTGKFFGYMPDILLSNPLTQISGNFNQVTISNCALATNVVP